MLYQKNCRILRTHDLSIHDRAFQYGDGCFTTARLKHGEIVLWHLHLQRLLQTAQALWLDISAQRLQDEIAHFLSFLSSQSQQYGVIKILISRGEGQRGYGFTEQPADIYCYFYPTEPSNVQQIARISQIGLADMPLSHTLPALRGLKTLNRLEQVWLKQYATQQQWQDLLCFDGQQHLVEAVVANVFCYIDEQWCTPDLALAGIRGIMRQEILNRMQAQQITCQIRPIHRAEIRQITAMFCCNALHPMQIVQQLSSQKMDEEPCQWLYKVLSLHELA